MSPLDPAVRTHQRLQIQQYLNQYTKQQLKEHDSRIIEAQLSQKIGQSFSREYVASLLYLFDEQVLYPNRDPSNFFDFYQFCLNAEQESLQRVSTILGREITQLSLDELINGAHQLFMLSPLEYHNYFPVKKINNEEQADWFSYNNDKDILFKYAAALGHPEVMANLPNWVRTKQFNLGYFELIAHLNLEERLQEHEEYKKKHNDLKECIPNLLSSVVHHIITEQQKNIPLFSAFDASLQSRHTIAPPKLLPQKTISLPSSPYCIQFTHEGHLAILHDNPQKSKDPTKPLELLLSLYDLNNHNNADSQLLYTTTTGLYPLFGFPDGNFLGSMTLGDDNILYISGISKKQWHEERVIKRYNSSLQEIKDTTDEFTKATKVLNEYGLDYMGISQVLKHKNLFYFLLQSGNMDHHQDVTLVSTDGKDIVDYVQYHNYGGMYYTAWKNNTQIFSCNDTIYLKALKNIFQFEKEFKKDILSSKEPLALLNHSPHKEKSIGIVNQDDDDRGEDNDEWEADDERQDPNYSEQDYSHSLTLSPKKLPPIPTLKITSLLREEDLLYECIPSNPALSPNGILYLVTQMPNEIVNSIKGYQLNPKSPAQFATHVYPENHPGGWPVLRSLAISHQNILAYTDVLGKKVHLYQLNE